MDGSSTSADRRLAPSLRSASDTPHDPRVVELLAELALRCLEFREIWERHDARGKGAEVKTFVHPEVGEITLRMQSFDVRSAPGQQMVVYHAEQG